MNSTVMAQAVQAAVKSKFRGQKVLKSKVVPRYPDNLAREYQRITNTYMTLLSQTVKEHLPEVRRAIAEEYANENMRKDDDNGVFSVVSRVFFKIQTEFEKKAQTFGLEQKIANLANLTRKLKIREWKRVVKNTLGIDIMEDYYMGEFFRSTMELWTQRNIDLIKSVPQKTIADMRNIILEGYRTGRTNTDIGKDIQEAYGIERRKAQFWARDQMGKLNSDITEAQQKDAGVQEYIWSDSDDGRVRPCHAYLNGTRQRWDSPPEIWYMTKSRGRVYTGRRCHPGQDYDCRCIPLPVFNLPGLDLPYEKGEG